MVEAANGRIAGWMDDLLDNMKRLADGIYGEKETAEGQVFIYREPPDRQANEYLINRVLGKPLDRHEHDYSDLSDEEIIAALQGPA